MNRVGPYELLGELGRGGMGVVYRARREGDESDVALKVIAAGEDASSEALARFQREARIATELDHPGIVKVREVGEHEGNAWFAMELVEGEPLSQQIREREFTWQEAVTIVRDVADALSVAHGKGVLHRDIKPSNILMDAEGKPHLTDFGLAKDTRTESKYTRTGQTLGTPAYMSPEQARGDLAELTPASDVWALGCVLYELLANRPAFEGDTPAAVVGAVLTAPIPPLPALPGRVGSLLDGALQRAPSYRYPHAGVFCSDASRVLRGDAVTWRPGRVSRRATSAAVAVLAVLGLVTLWWLPSGGPGPSRPDGPARQARALAERGWRLRHSDAVKAAGLLREAIALHGDQDAWRLQLGLVLWLHGSPREARDVWSSVRSADAAADAQLLLAWEAVFRYEREGGRRWDLARDDLRALAEATGPNAELARAALAVEAQEFRAARALLRNKHTWQAQFLRAQLEHSDPEGDPRAALRAYASAFDSGWRFAWAYHARGVLHRELGNDAEAIADYTRAIELDDTFDRAYLNRGVIHFQAGRLEHAAADYDRAIECAPDDPLARQHRGRLRFTKRDWAGAVADLARAYHVAPDAKGCAQLYGASLVNNGQHAEAVPVLTHAVRIAPDDGYAYRWRAEALRELFKLEAALADAVRATELKQADSRSWWLRSRVLRNLGRAAESVPFVERAIALDRDNALYCLERALVAFACRDIDGSEHWYDEALKLNPQYARALVGRSHVLMMRRDYTRAAADLRRAISLEPALADAYGTLGVALRQLDDHAGAVKAFERFLELVRPDDPKRPTAEAWLADSRRKLAATGR